MHLSRKNLPRLVFKLAIPAVLENISHTMLHLADALMIATLGKIGLAAVAGLAILGFALAQPSGDLPQRTWSPPSLDEVSAVLNGLSFDHFIDVSYEQYLLRRVGCLLVCSVLVCSLGVGTDGVTKPR